MLTTNRLIRLAVGAALLVPHSGVVAQQFGDMRWFGSVYAKFLDGDRRLESALYNNADTTPGEAGGDQGQGIEFELMFQNQVSKQVEIGGRLKARFNQNFWANFGGFGEQEEDERSAQYVKMRGVYARLTPGYDWIDSALVGSSDFGMFDPWTQGKYRYIDRDNASGLIFQGSAMDKQFRWDVARLSLPRLFSGPEYNTGELFANDAAWTFQGRYAVTSDANITGIYQWIQDDEIDEQDMNILNGTQTTTRFEQDVFGIKGDYSGLDFMDMGFAFYYSDYTVNDNVCDGTLNGNCRFSPTLQDNADGEAFTIDLDINEVGLGDLAFNIQVFHIGADYSSVTSARRESDVLITEGREGTWGWGRPDYNFGNPNNTNSQAGLGYGGWNGHAHQVASLMADNDFTDFDESMAETVIGWEGITIIPKWTLGEWEMAAEYSYIDFDTNWQACDEKTKADCIYPRQEGTNSWGLGGANRSPFSPYQDREMQIFALSANTTFDWFDGTDFGARVKYIKDEDDRLTNANLRDDAYDGYVDAAGFALNPDWEALPEDQKQVNVKDDDRDVDYYTVEFSLGNQIFRDLYVRALYSWDYVDLYDGTTNVAPIGLGFEGSNEFGYAEYLTGEHYKNKVALQLQYFLSGVEIGADIQYIWGDFDPEFSVGEGQTLQVTPDGRAVITPLGNISKGKTDLEQYRMKAFMKVQF